MTKSEIRNKYLKKRQRLTITERDAAALQIFERTVSRFNLEGKNISVFMPIERLQEVNTGFFLNGLKSKFYLPVVQENSQLTHVLFEDEKQLALNNWGIREPKYGSEIEVSKINIVLVPLLACDRAGNRVGYGKAFYDIFLKDCSPSCRFIGLSFFEPIEEISGIQESDIPLHHCVTPKKIYSFKS